MSKIRVYDLAKKLNLDNKELLSMLDKQGIKVKSPLSMIEDDVKIIEEMKKEVKMDNVSEGISKEGDNGKDKKETVTPQKLISTEELTKKGDSSIDQKNKEKLSIFYRGQNTDDTPSDAPKVKTRTAEPVESVKGSSYFSTGLSIIGIGLSIVAVIVALLFASKTGTGTGIAPQTIASLMNSQGDASYRLSLMKKEIDQLRSELFEERKDYLQRESRILEYFITKADGNTKVQLEKVVNDLSLLINELN